jgi:hypothetical protein
MAFLKHVGRHSGTGQRLSVAFLQLPDDKENALVVYSDSLPDRYHQDFMAAVESNEGQAAKSLYEVLARKVFWHGTTMLETLHKENHLVKIPTSQIIMTPNSNTSIPLNDILAQMDGFEVSEDAIADNDTTQTVTESQVDINVDESKKDENKQIAQNLLVQAQLLEEDAKRKRAEAYKYDPSLAPKESKVTITPASEDGEPTKKRGRGRPPKTVEA